jgi:hypothetical protein
MSITRQNAFPMKSFFPSMAHVTLVEVGADGASVKKVVFVAAKGLMNSSLISIWEGG